MKNWYKKARLGAEEEAEAKYQHYLSATMERDIKHIIIKFLLEQELWQAKINKIEPSYNKHNNFMKLNVEITINNLNEINKVLTQKMSIKNILEFEISKIIKVPTSVSIKVPPNINFLLENIKTLHPKYSIKEIASTYGVSYSQLIALLRILKIPPRTQYDIIPESEYKNIENFYKTKTVQQIAEIYRSPLQPIRDILTSLNIPLR